MKVDDFEIIVVDDASLDGSVVRIQEFVVQDNRIRLIQKKENGVWSDTTTNKKLETQIEDQILNEARILRINSLK